MRKNSPRGPGASNVFSSNYQSSTQRADRSYYKKLYHFNADVELAEFSLPTMSNQQSPAGGHRRTTSGVVNATKLPPLGGNNLEPTMEEDELAHRQDEYGGEMGMDGMEGEYGHEQPMDEEMDPEEYDRELAD